MLFDLSNTAKILGILSVLTAVAAGTGTHDAQARMTYTYTTYDSNQNEYLDRDEYLDYSYEKIDLDNDGMINEDEWSSYKTVWYEPYDVQRDVQFTAYDLDQNNRIDRAEFTENVDDTLYGEWDTDNDGRVNAREFNTTIVSYENVDGDNLYDW